jgi:FixJ family two-component response regulator
MFIESGMSDFLTKPMDHKEVERVLRQWLPRDKWGTDMDFEDARR